MVGEVRIVSEDGKVLEASTSAISVEVGKPLDREKVAASLRSLYRTGVYSDIRAISEHVEGGIRVDFIVRENLFFNQVIVLGLKPPPSEASAAAAMQITLGDAFRKQTLDEALDRLKARLQEEGLYTAKIRRACSGWRDPSDKQYRIPGQRNRFEVQIKGWQGNHQRQNTERHKPHTQIPR